MLEKKEPFKKLPAIEGHTICATCNCGPKNELDMGRVVGVGFGSAGYSKNGVTLWQEAGQDYDELPTVADVEALAKQDPNADWRIFFYAPLYESEYQR